MSLKSIKEVSFHQYSALEGACTKIIEQERKRFKVKGSRIERR